MTRAVLARYPALVLALAAVLVVSTGATAFAGGDDTRKAPPSFRISADCTELFTSVLVPADRAHRLVPPGFTLEEVAGQARVNLFAEDCTNSVDGGDRSPSIVGGIGIVLNASRSRGGCPGYALVWTNGQNDEFSRAFTRIGWDMEVVEESTFGVAPVAGAGITGDAAVPLDRAPFELHATGPDTPSAPNLPFTSVHCHLGPRGLVRGTYRHEFSAVSALAGRIVVGEAELWDELGVRSQTVPMLLFRFTGDGPTEILPEERPARARLAGCTDTFLLVEGDEEAIRSAVPARYALGGEVPAGAQLWSISSACDEIRVGGGPSRPGTVAFLGASVETPDGPKGPGDIHSYLLWAVTSHRRLQRALGVGGFPAYHEPRTRQTTSPGVLLGESLLDVPWSGSPYRIEALTTPVATYPHNHDAHWWYDGPDGPGEVVVRLALSSENAADCVLKTTAGTRLATLLGATERETACFLQGPTSSTIEF